MAPRPRDYQPGERVPGTVYLVARMIGAGGMGTVYDVEDTSIGKRYVLKTLHPQLGDREDLARRMTNEARTLAHLHHPNIVEVITAGVTADELHLPYYVMERLNGQSLRLVLEKKGQVDLPHAYHIAIDLLDALDHAHDSGVIHRDVKPDNIFLHRTSAGMTVTKLLDFGILSMLDGQNRETAGRFLGTLRYAAPEQLRGERPTPKVDIYAAALVLYEMIAGRGPFDDEGDQHRVAAAHLHKPPRPPSHFVIVPRELDALIMSALSKSPEARPRDAFSFAASLRNFKKALAGAHRRESTDQRATGPALLEPDVAPFVDVRQASSDKYVISPAPAATPPMSRPAPAPAPVPTSLPKTTLPGMSPPAAGVAPAPTVTTPAPVDRMAPTNSIAVETPRGPQHGTESLPFTPAPLVAARPTHPMSPSPAATPFQWPVEKPTARSEEPQVRSLEASSAPGSVLPIVGAVASVVLLALVAGALLVARYHATSTSAASTPVPSPQASILAVPPPPVPVVTVPAPTIAPPALDDTPSSTAAPSSLAPLAPAASSAGKPVVAPVRPVAPSRPGPGF